jgi:lysozyme family protein
MSVNHGINGAIKILQRAANVKPDGIVGPITLRAIKDVKLLDLALERVKRFVIITEKRPKNLVFLRGWINRVSEVVDFTNKL